MNVRKSEVIWTSFGEHGHQFDVTRLHAGLGTEGGDGIKITEQGHTGNGGSLRDIGNTLSEATPLSDRDLPPKAETDGDGGKATSPEAVPAGFEPTAPKGRTDCGGFPAIGLNGSEEPRIEIAGDRGGGREQVEGSVEGGFGIEFGFEIAQRRGGGGPGVPDRWNRCVGQFKRRGALKLGQLIGA